jgi:hypothetical protein
MGVYYVVNALLMRKKRRRKGKNEMSSKSLATISSSLMNNTNNTYTYATKGSVIDMEEAETEEQAKKERINGMILQLSQGGDVEKTNKACNLGLWHIYLFGVIRVYRIFKNLKTAAASVARRTIFFQSMH